MLGDLESLIHAALAEWQIPGLAIAVVQHDEPAFVQAFGQRDVEADGSGCLVPYQDRIFTIAPLEGFRVEFQRAEGEAVDAIVFHQPNGTFRARRQPP